MSREKDLTERRSHVVLQMQTKGRKYGATDLFCTPCLAKAGQQMHSKLAAGLNKTCDVMICCKIFVRSIFVFREVCWGFSQVVSSPTFRITSNLWILILAQVIHKKLWTNSTFQQSLGGLWTEAWTRWIRWPLDLMIWCSVPCKLT